MKADGRAGQSERSSVATAAAVIILMAATSLWLYITYLHGFSDGWDEALNQRRWGLPIAEIAIGMGLALGGSYCARQKPRLALSAGCVSLIFAAVIWLAHVA